MSETETAARACWAHGRVNTCRAGDGCEWRHDVASIAAVMAYQRGETADWRADREADALMAAVAEVLAEHVGVEGYFDQDLYRNYACSCGWWCTADQSGDLAAHIAQHVAARVQVEVAMEEVLREAENDSSDCLHSDAGTQEFRAVSEVHSMRQESRHHHGEAMIGPKGNMINSSALPNEIWESLVLIIFGSDSERRYAMSEKEADLAEQIVIQCIGQDDPHVKVEEMLTEFAARVRAGALREAASQMPDFRDAASNSYRHGTAVQKACRWLRARADHEETGSEAK